jgi:hypothetical protein
MQVILNNEEICCSNGNNSEYDITFTITGRVCVGVMADGLMI